MGFEELRGKLIYVAQPKLLQMDLDLKSQFMELLVHEQEKDLQFKVLKLLLLLEVMLGSTTAKELQEIGNLPNYQSEINVEYFEALRKQPIHHCFAKIMRKVFNLCLS